MATREELLERIFYKMKMIGNDEERLFRPLEKQDVYDILSAETKEQQECEYCHDVTLEEYHKLLEENTTDDSRYIVKVKYCEVCGRKLGDEDERD